MAQLVDSQALQRVSKTLQLSTPGSQETLFIDERLEQVIDVSPIVRRGLTLAGSEGIYSANIRNTHSGAQGNVSTAVDVYNLGGSARPPFPQVIPLDQDLWITGFMAEVVSGNGQFQSGFFDLLIPTVNQAFGTISTNIVLAGWTGSDLALAGTNFMMKASSGQSTDSIFSMPRIRVPRNTQLRWHTRNNGANAPVFQLDLLLGLFPSSLGQDGFA